MNEDRQFSVSRRKVLAGLGTIGIASAGAGLGTTAYFSDQETFQNNQLTAGTLDMKVDWEEHYSDWSDDEAAFASMGTMEEHDIELPALTSGGQLVADAKPIYLTLNGETAGEKQTAKDGLWDATSVEAFPDVLNGDGSYDGIQDAFSDEEACDILTDVGGNSSGLSDPRRTQGTFAGQTTEEGDPLINIQDVKPGDFGEVTFSFHLCDNPGYVWLNGDLIEARENGHTEPENEDPDSVGPSDEVSEPGDLETSQVELLDEIVTRVWYDPNGNNQVDMLSGELDIMIAIDASGSISGDKNQSGTEANNLVQGVDEFVAALAASPADIEAGQVLFGENSSLTSFTGLGSPGALPTMASVYPNSNRGNTPLPAALDVCDQELATGRPGADKIIVAFTDGGPNYSADSYSAGGYTAPRDGVGYSEDGSSGNGYDNNGGGTVTVGEEEETALVAETIRDSGSRIVVVNVADDPTEDQGSTGVTLREYLSGTGSPYPEGGIASSGFYFEVDLANLEAVADSLAASVAVSEEVFFQGTLREVLMAMADNDGRGIPLDGDVSTAFDELSDPENDADRDCFAGEGTTHYVGFQWWLPIDHANQIQSDSVSFDVGFYTEQCRHNDGAGMVPEEPVEIQS
ncbi:SipW-dependent-type signal peptide-containing protein [Haloplanus aerogenes]|uniref:Putative ribosomally synthesized peptide with SipW-like signal peptide n=1 Tax=Haloplanus aerogenes TaxID=660522 RepID=A0A3M0DVE1_9EURY|nr:SipW-dependent-type signal peptide-containing protein [Haloplanus aerogenes]RMB25097.1 putative ribosomally synthesized peptide with SipW-like signal peptide [Haloplanus aerogenes]